MKREPSEHDNRRRHGGRRAVAPPRQPLRHGILAGIALVTALSPAFDARGQSVDRVRTATGVVSGTIVETTPQKIVVQKGETGQVDVDVNTISNVAFAGEPPALTQARSHIAAGRSEDAQQALTKIDMSKVTRPEIKQDIEYFQALSAARLALSGQGPLEKAGKMMYGFLTQNEDSFHYFEACAVLGDLLSSRGDYDKAETYYRKMATAPWPEVKMRCGLLIAQTLLAREKPAEALTQISELLQENTDAGTAKGERAAATILQAVCLAETGKADTGIGILTDVIAKTDPEEARTQAQAYNALGKCYLKAGKTKDALLAFLHVDVLYNTLPEHHAEALAQLAPLWEAIGKADRARQTRKLLQERYPNSRWAR